MTGTWGGNQGVWVLPLAGDSDPIPFLLTPFTELWGRLSPDSRWMAYMSDESGQPEIYVQDFPESGGKWQISTSGGAYPQWRGDGNELFYLGLDGNLMAVDIEADGDTPVAGIPQVLFPINGPTRLQRNNYDVTADGQRFLVNAFVENVGERTDHLGPQLDSPVGAIGVRRTLAPRPHRSLTRPDPQ